MPPLSFWLAAGTSVFCSACLLIPVAAGEANEVLNPGDELAVVCAGEANEVLNPGDELAVVCAGEANEVLNPGDELAVVYAGEAKEVLNPSPAVPSWTLVARVCVSWE